MEVWINERRQEVMSKANVTIAFAVHVAFFLGLFLFSFVNLKPRETVIPITFITSPQTEVPKPSVDVPKRSVDVSAISGPSVSHGEVTGVKAVVERPEKPIGQKKTRAELQQERIARIRGAARLVDIKKQTPSANECVADRRITEAEARKRLGEGEPNKGTPISASMMQYCVARVQMAINARWAQANPRISAGGVVHIAVRFTAIGQMVDCRITKSCGNSASDAAALMVVQTAGPIAGLNKEFLREFSHQDLVIRYTVQSRP